MEKMPAPVAMPKIADGFGTKQMPEASRRLQGDALRQALVELRDTPDDARAAELKKIISYSICGV